MLQGKMQRYLDLVRRVDENPAFPEATYDCLSCQSRSAGAATGMVFEHIEKLKREYTDKYVVVDASRPELARFRDCTGQIKTVNMNGQALVQFDAWNNIGWYDIALDFLRVVPKPEPKPVQEAVREKAPPAAANAKGATIGKPGQDVRETDIPGSKPGVAAKPVAGKPSTADILAAARAKKGTPAASSEAAPAAKPAGKMSTSDILAAARAKGGSPAPAKSPAAQPASKKLSTAEILAAARAKEASPPPVAAMAAAAPAQPEAEEAAEEPSATPAATAPAKPASAAGPLPTTTAEKIAWCRARDAK